MTFENLNPTPTPQNEENNAIKTLVTGGVDNLNKLMPANPSTVIQGSSNFNQTEDNDSDSSHSSFRLSLSDLKNINFDECPMPILPRGRNYEDGLE